VLGDDVGEVKRRASDECEEVDPVAAGADRANGIEGDEVY